MKLKEIKKWIREELHHSISYKVAGMYLARDNIASEEWENRKDAREATSLIISEGSKAFTSLDSDEQVRLIKEYGKKSSYPGKINPDSINSVVKNQQFAKNIISYIDDGLAELIAASELKNTNILTDDMKETLSMIDVAKEVIPLEQSFQIFIDLGAAPASKLLPDKAPQKGDIRHAIFTKEGRSEALKKLESGDDKYVNKHLTENVNYVSENIRDMLLTEPDSRWAKHIKEKTLPEEIKDAFMDGYSAKWKIDKEVMESLVNNPNSKNTRITAALHLFVSEAKLDIEPDKITDNDWLKIGLILQEKKMIQKAGGHFDKRLGRTGKEEIQLRKLKNEISRMSYDGMMEKFVKRLGQIDNPQRGKGLQ